MVGVASFSVVGAASEIDRGDLSSVMVGVASHCVASEVGRGDVSSVMVGVASLSVGVVPHCVGSDSVASKGLLSSREGSSCMVVGQEGSSSMVVN